jgi:hypothetical protein
MRQYTYSVLCDDARNHFSLVKVESAEAAFMVVVERVELHIQSAAKQRYHLGAIQTDTADEDVFVLELCDAFIAERGAGELGWCGVLYGRHYRGDGLIKT